jgi:hypothetical protein
MMRYHGHRSETVSMRLPILPLALLAVPAAASGLPQGTLAAQSPACRSARLQPAAADASARIRPLAEEPPATQVLALLHTEGGCSKPIPVRAKVGPAR